VIILLVIAAIYTMTVWFGMKGISKLAASCSYLFITLLVYVLIGGGECTYILETGFSAIGNLVQNFIGMATWMDPLRTTSFPQNWTVYYWAYWMVWCVAAPFFIGSISRGRTVRQTILGGYIFGVGSTLTSFIVLGNYSMGMQVTGKADFIAQYLESGDLYGMIVSIIKTMPGAPVIMVVVLLTMIAFYATSFDSIALTASCYSYHTLRDGEQPNKVIQLMWCILLILLPIALLFAESSMNNLQSVSIVAAFPIGVVIVMIAVSFMKDAKKYMQNMEEKGQQEVDNVDNEK
jgi:BCCT family betaine/carnitine transporter